MMPMEIRTRQRKCIAEYIKSGVATSYDLYELGMQEMQDGNYKNALTYFNSGLELEKVPNKQNLMKSALRHMSTVATLIPRKR